MLDLRPSFATGRLTGALALSVPLFPPDMLGVRIHQCTVRLFGGGEGGSGSSHFFDSTHDNRLALLLIALLKLAALLFRFAHATCLVGCARHLFRLLLVQHSANRRVLSVHDHSSY